MTGFSTLYLQHWPDVLRFALYLCGNMAEAEDLASEAFLRAWMSTQPIRVATIKAYLFVIVRNLYRDRLRRSSRVTTLNGALSEPRPGPDQVAADVDDLARVLAAMQTLSEADRSILAMTALDPMPQSTIAAALGISVSAVKVRIHRARLRLNAALTSDSDRMGNAP